MAVRRSEMAGPVALGSMFGIFEPTTVMRAFRTTPPRPSRTEAVRSVMGVMGVSAALVRSAAGAMRNANPAKDRLVAVNSADDQVNPPELGILEAQIKRVKKGRAVIIPISEKTRGHSTHSWPAIWGSELAGLLKVSVPKP